MSTTSLSKRIKAEDCSWLNVFVLCLLRFPRICGDVMTGSVILNIYLKHQNLSRWNFRQLKREKNNKKTLVVFGTVFTLDDISTNSCLSPDYTSVIMV